MRSTVTAVCLGLGPALAFLAAACSSTAGAGNASDATTSGPAAGGSGGAGMAASVASSSGAGGSSQAVTIGGSRAATLYVPAGYDSKKAAPLVFLLHGYSASGFIQDAYFGFKALADARGYLYVVPDGTTNQNGQKFWNATDACCNFGGSTVDDSAYLASLIAEVKAKYNVDPKRVFFTGHSNGGFMSYRMACDHADQVAAIVSLAGATFLDDTKCKPVAPVAILQIHGTSDNTILYDGASKYPGALATTKLWAAHDGCGATSMAAGMIDLEANLTGAETAKSVFASGCKPGGHAELWTIAAGPHIPALTSEFAPAVFDFLQAHPKP